jgi:hypothetical protein
MAFAVFCATMVGGITKTTCKMEGPWEKGANNYYIC